MSNRQAKAATLLGETTPSKAIIKLAIPATLGMLAKAIYNIVDTLYIGMLGDDIALAAVGVTIPLLMIMVALENIFASGSAVLIGRQLGAKDHESASRTLSTIVFMSIGLGLLLCLGGIVFLDPLMRFFGASAKSLPQAKDYAFWMLVAAVANLPAMNMNFAARAESSVKIATISLMSGALLNVLLDPIFMFEWGLGMGVGGASLATTISQFVSFFLLIWFYAGGRSVVKLKLASFKPSLKLIRGVAIIGIPTALSQICLSISSSLTNIAVAPLPHADQIIASYGVVQRLVLIGVFIVIGFMQGYQPVVTYAYGAKNKERFQQSVRFALKGTIFLTLVVGISYIVLAKPLMSIFNGNPIILDYGKWFVVSQMAIFPAFGLCFLLTITLQTIGAVRLGLILSVLRQGLFYIPFILVLPPLLGVNGVYLSQPFADVLSLTACLLLFKPMKHIAMEHMAAVD